MLILLIIPLVFGLVGMFYARFQEVSFQDYVGSKNRYGAFSTFSTLLATSLGVWILFSPAELAMTMGIVGWVGYAASCFISYYIFLRVGVYLRKKMPHATSLLDFVKEHFGGSYYMTVKVVVAAFLILFIASELAGIALASQLLCGFKPWMTALIVGGLTLLYTLEGGFAVSVFTDKLQNILILPLIALVFIAGASAFFSAGNTVPLPDTFFDYRMGGAGALSLVIAVCASELFNQASWQRVYAAKSIDVLKKSFLWAGGCYALVVLIMGAFGFFAAKRGISSDPSIALLAFLKAGCPKGILYITFALITLLVMSSVDSLLSAVASLFVGKSRDVAQPKLVTLGAGVLSIVISLTFSSVLYIVLLADWFAVLVAGPILLALFDKCKSPSRAVLASSVGALASVYFFPNPNFSRGSLFTCFVLALVLPTFVAAVKWRPRESSLDSAPSNLP